jgi:hypothetical protein
MSIKDTVTGLIGKGKQAVASNPDKVNSAVDKARGLASKATAGKYDSAIDKAANSVKKAASSQGGGNVVDGEVDERPDESR